MKKSQMISYLMAALTVYLYLAYKGFFIARKNSYRIIVLCNLNLILV